MNKSALETFQQGLNGLTAFAPYGYRESAPTPMNLDNFLGKVQFERLSFDIGEWRDVIREFELAYYPMRVKGQRMFMDTVVNPFVKAVYDKWKELTMQRDTVIYQVKNGVKIESKDLTQAAEAQVWLKDIREFALEALAYGYSLVSTGNIVNDAFPNVSSIRRENIRPDGIGDSGPILSSLVYAVDGIKVTNDPLIDMCNFWFPTKSSRGVSKCGYGFLYEVAFCEIHLRHVMEWNADYVEMFGQPIKKGFTNKTDKARKQFERMLASPGSNSWVLLDRGTNDDITYEAAQNAGTAWKCYDNMEKRLEDKICQLMLGHSDAMATSPDKLGGNQKSNKDGDNINMVQQAINAKQIWAGDFVCRKFNEEVAPKLRRLGTYVGSKTIAEVIPDGYYFGLKNDTEENEIKRKDNQHRVLVSTWVENLNKAGYNVDVEQLGEIMGGLKLTEAPPEQKLLQYRKTETEITRNDEDSTGAKPKESTQIDS